VKPHTSASQKVVLLLCGLLVALTLLEVGLRAGGRAFLWMQERRNRASLREGRPFRILCIGESTTALGGEDAYPKQLERVLNEQAARPLVSVINRGVPATDTAEILARLPPMLEQYRPDAVVAMIGINDVAGASAPEHTATRQVLASTRVYKLARFAWGLTRGRYAIPPPPTPRFEAEVEAKERRLRARVAASASDEGAVVELGTLYLARGRLEDARRLLEQARTLDPRSELALLGLAIVEQRRGDAQLSDEAIDAAATATGVGAAAQREVAREYLRFFESETATHLTTLLFGSIPSDDQASRMLKTAYFHAAERCTRERRLDDAEALLHRGRTLPGEPSEDLYYGQLALVAQARGDQRAFEERLGRARTLRALREEPSTPTARNYRELRQLLRERGIPLVAVQYPMRSVDSLRRMLHDDEGIVFVDNEAVFKEALRAAPYTEYFADAFAGDFGHLTPKGNRLLAANVADAIRGTILDRYGLRSSR